MRRVWHMILISFLHNSQMTRFACTVSSESFTRFHPCVERCERGPTTEPQTLLPSRDSDAKDPCEPFFCSEGYHNVVIFNGEIIWIPFTGMNQLEKSFGMNQFFFCLCNLHNHQRRATIICSFRKSGRSWLCIREPCWLLNQSPGCQVKV